MSRKKYKKKLFIYFIFYIFLHIVDAYVSLLYLVDGTAVVEDWGLVIKRDVFLNLGQCGFNPRGMDSLAAI